MSVLLTKYVHSEVYLLVIIFSKWVYHWELEQEFR